MCEEQIFPLAINYMDRFLCVCIIKRQQLQLLGATCLLIASKIRSSNILSVDLLCAYTDYSVTYDHMVVSNFIFDIPISIFNVIQIIKNDLYNSNFVYNKTIKSL